MCLPDGLGTVDGGAHARLDVVIVALVLMLLLTPHQVSIGVFLSLGLDQIEGEWRELRDGRGVRGQPSSSLLLAYCILYMQIFALAHLKFFRSHGISTMLNTHHDIYI